MNSRTWLAVGLCCFVWFVYMRWFAPLPPPVHPTESTKIAATGEANPVENTAPAVAGSGHSLLNATVADTDSYRVENNKFSVSFSDVGGKINSIQLKDYTETIQPGSPGIQTISPALSSQDLGTFFTDPSFEGFAGATYQRTDLSDGVEYSHLQNGIELKKTYSVDKNDYLLQSTYQLTLPDSDRKDWGYLLIPVGARNVQYDAKTPLNSWEVVAYQNESITRRNWEKIPGEMQVLQGNTSWVAFGNRYFATALINRSEINPDILLAKASDFSGAYLRYPIVPKAGQKQITYSVQIFSGPKEYSTLAKVPGMKQLIDYGTFSFFAYPLLELLQFFYRFVHNYGVAIILLTLVVRALFYPLSMKSYKSMKAMQKLQPQIAALKEKHKDDTQRFGQEQMALFKAHKVNPAGGCLPMLVQLPVFIALYAVLGNSLELFHAPFFGWIHDLSAKDPYYIFPVLMGISMFLQQKMTPAAGMDPAQQKIMLLMPVIFTFIMLNLPSGLTIYIFLSTILGVLQQVAMNKEKKNVSPALVVAPQK